MNGIDKPYSIVLRKRRSRRCLAETEKGQGISRRRFLPVGRCEFRGRLPGSPGEAVRAGQTKCLVCLPLRRMAYSTKEKARMDGLPIRNALTTSKVMWNRHPASTTQNTWYQNPRT